MPDDPNVTSELIKGGVEVVKAAYDDALKPFAIETGKALSTIGKSVNMALGPLRTLVWGYGQIEEWVVSGVATRLEKRGVPAERVITPDPDIAVPTVEALRYSKLKEEFANLLTTAMDKNTAGRAHPSFVEMLKQLTPGEAKMLKFFRGLGFFEPVMAVDYKVSGKGDYPSVLHLSTIGQDVGCDSEMVPAYIDNLCRLGLTVIPSGRFLAEEERYSRIRALPDYEEAKRRMPEGAKFIEIKRMLGLTPLGVLFRFACINEDPMGSQQSA